jgi:hypothetical protein
MLKSILSCQPAKSSAAYVIQQGPSKKVCARQLRGQIGAGFSQKWGRILKQF